ncbi:MAG: FoF1 ATP synthase subunit gamma [Chloroflexota bacterium]|nr:FoF1 ATP synthase subunit gamma [Chloroflexota bacterium]
MEESKRIQERLDNVRSVEPILSALRTISMGSWRAALNQMDRVRRYEVHLAAVVPPLLPHLPIERARRRAAPEFAHAAVLVVGSERGLCGAFNVAAVERVEAYLAELDGTGVKVDLLALGSRVHRFLQRRDHELSWWGKLSLAKLPSFNLALSLTRRWLTQYEERELDVVDVAHNAYRGTGEYEPTVTRLIPPRPPDDEAAPSHDPWFPTIVETDPLRLYARVAEQWTAISLHRLLLDSAAAEHAARYRLMETATQNAEELIDELTATVQAARQQAITQEMQELAASAGLIGQQDD